jgi:NAD(P)-dependent dehydrogenase (short-subunit alcohol dehydrogenase family)
MPGATPRRHLARRIVSGKKLQFLRTFMPKNVVLITGCSTGFGRLIAETVARRKMYVFAGMRSIHDRNAAHARDIEKLAERESLDLRPIELDVTNDYSVSDAVDAVIQQAGQIDVLVNNAGISIRGLCEPTAVDQTRRIFETNVLGVQRMNRAVLPHMRKRGTGLLIHISSQAGRVVIPGFGIYGASKFALEALVESYRYELAGEGIDCISVQPGAYATAIGQNAEKAVDENRLAEYGPARNIPQKLLENMKRRDPQEIADAVLRLIEMPAGSRPLRTPVGATGDFVSRLNNFTDRIEQELLNALGLSSYTEFRSRDEAK